MTGRQGAEIDRVRHREPASHRPIVGRKGRVSPIGRRDHPAWLTAGPPAVRHPRRKWSASTPAPLEDRDAGAWKPCVYLTIARMTVKACWPRARNLGRSLPHHTRAGFSAEHGALR
jgi:hypothetical protein